MQLDTAKISSIKSHLPDIDISAVTFNSSKWLHGFFSSLLEQSYPLDKINLHIRDNGSSDDTLSLLENFRVEHGSTFTTMTIEAAENIGFGPGHNSNFKHSKEVFFLVTNVDLCFVRDTLTTLVNVALNDDKNVASWECRQKPYEHPKHYHPVTLETVWSSSACVLFRHSAFKEVGGYEEKLFLYGEDVELSFRLRDYGYVLRYIPKAVVWHYAYEGAHQFKPDQFFGSTLANALLRLRYGNALNIAMIIPLFLTLFLRSKPVPDYGRKLLKNILKLCCLAPSFLLTRKRSTIDFPFCCFDYEFSREGSFYCFRDLPGEQPLVSVIIRTIAGNAGKLREAVQSVLNQTYPNIELVVVEDGSNTSKDYCDSIIEQGCLNHVVYRALPHVGRCRAGNEALSLVTGELICFLDDDDLLYADHFEVLVSELMAHPNMGAAYGLALETKTKVISHEPWVYHEMSRNVTYRQNFSRPLIWYKNYIPIQSIVFKRRLYELYGGFDEEMERLEDWNLWVRYSMEWDFMIVEKATSLYRVPADINVGLDRQRDLDSYYEKAVNKYQEMPIKVTLKEIIDFSEVLINHKYIFATRIAKLSQFISKTPLLNHMYFLFRLLWSYYTRRNQK